MAAVGAGARVCHDPPALPGRAQVEPAGVGKKLGVSQPRVVKLKSGEHNPEIDTIIKAVKRLGIEFVLDVAPVSRKPALVTARAQKRGAIEHDEVSVVVASSD